jgi:hypothetical protein
MRTSLSYLIIFTPGDVNLYMVKKAGGTDALHEKFFQTKKEDNTEHKKHNE